MKKKLFMFSLATLLTAGVSQAQTVLFSENFNATTNTALPTGWAINPVSTTSWKSGVSSSLSSQSFPIPDLDGRMVMINDDAAGQAADNNNAFLTSATYDLAGQTGVWLSFDLAYLKGSYDGDDESLDIEISTNGGTTWTALQSDVPGNTVTIWETKYYNLSAYTGTVKIGFRYSDGGGWLFGAAVDNIKLFQPLAKDLQLTAAGPVEGDAAAYVPPGNPVTLTGSVFNNSGAAVTAYTIKYQQGSNPVVSTNVPSVNIAPFTTADFPTTVTFTPTAAQNYPLKVWVELTGDLDHTNDSANAFVAGTSFTPTKRVVFEESTCTKCTWCPRGTVTMDGFAAANPGVAAQIAVHTNDQGPDAMAMPAYGTVIQQSPGYQGNPAVVVDRSETNGLPGQGATAQQVALASFTESYNTHKEYFGFADITLGTPTITSTSVSMPVTVKPGVDITGAKLALVVTESNIIGTGSGYDQTNAYSGGGQGPMGGFENKPSPVPAAAIRYHFVARAISPSPEGGASGLPNTMTAGTVYTATPLTATLNAAWNPANLQYIVLLISADGKILNSNFTEEPTLEAVLVGSTAVANVSAGINGAMLYPNPAKNVTYMQVNAQQASNATITITDAIGRSIAAAPIKSTLQSGENRIMIPTQELSNGMYFVNLATEKGNVSLKLQVVK